MYSCPQHKDLVFKIIGAAMEVHNKLKWGLLEAVYQEALHIELTERGISNQREQEISIFYKDHLLDKRYKMDIVVKDVIIELKSVVKIRPEHRAQICNYLRLTKNPVGLLINFGEDHLVGERWGYDQQTNHCYLLDKDMNQVPDIDYEDLLFQHLSEGE